MNGIDITIFTEYIITFLKMLVLSSSPTERFVTITPFVFQIRLIKYEMIYFIP